MANRKECEHYGIDVEIVEKFEKRITKLLKDMDGHKLDLFCGSSCSIRAKNWNEKGRQLVVGHFLGGNTDGGAGGTIEDECGLLRGE